MSLKVEHKISIQAAPERVWKAWVEDMNQWWIQPYYNDEVRATGHHIEPRLGGRYTEDWGDEGRGFLIGTILEWDPPSLLAHTWTERDWGGANTLVRLELKAEGRSGTLLTFMHDGFEHVPDGEHQRGEHEHGWGDLINHFKSTLEK